MRKFLATVALLGGLLMVSEPVVHAVDPASADDPQPTTVAEGWRCLTRAEFRAIDQGWTRRQVQALSVDTDAGRMRDNERVDVYNACKSPGIAIIRFHRKTDTSAWRVVAKRGLWIR